MKRLLLYIIVVFLVLLGVSFAIINSEPVTFNYYAGETVISLSMLLVLSFAIGGLFGMLACIGLYMKTKQQSLRFKRQAKLANKALDNLRATHHHQA